MIQINQKKFDCIDNNHNYFVTQNNEMKKEILEITESKFNATENN